MDVLNSAMQAEEQLCALIDQTSIDGLLLVGKILAVDPPRGLHLAEVLARGLKEIRTAVQVKPILREQTGEGPFGAQQNNTLSMLHDFFERALKLQQSTVKTRVDLERNLRLAKQLGDEELIERVRSSIRESIEEDLEGP